MGGSVPPCNTWFPGPTNLSPQPKKILTKVCKQASHSADNTDENSTVNLKHVFNNDIQENAPIFVKVTNSAFPAATHTHIGQ